MTQLTDLFDITLFEEMYATGMIRIQTHPEFEDLKIVNYTEAAQFSRTWNEVTRVCRGLIYNALTGEVLARPFQKIHNWDETEAPRITWEAPLFDWSNKEDGSLGIMYRNPDGGIAIATRGSFASEQALHATELMNNGPVWMWEEDLDNDFTPLFEIIYPENRIVLDYGDIDELVYLGKIHRPTGAFYPADAHKPRTFGDLIQDLSRENAEGWVAWLDPYKAVKIKQADYVELHRIVTGLSEKSVWRAIRDGEYDKMLESLPDELYAWAEGVSGELRATANSLIRSAKKYYERAGRDVTSQKQFALNVQEQVPRHMRGYVFSLRSGKDIFPAVWKAIEPSGKRD